MRRTTFDAVLTALGLALAVLLVVAGGLLSWGSSFVSSQVSGQLSAQRIFLPAAGSPALADPAIAPYLTRYAGQQLTTGEQAKAYADHFIAVHLKALSGGRTYAELGTAQSALKARIAESAKSGASTAALDSQLAALKGTRDLVFQGETLRGLLLNAYAFGTMGRIAGIAAAVAFTGAGVLLLLSLLGVLHLRRAHDQVVRVPGWHPESAAV